MEQTAKGANENEERGHQNSPKANIAERSAGEDDFVIKQRARRKISPGNFQGINNGKTGGVQEPAPVPIGATAVKNSEDSLSSKARQKHTSAAVRRGLSMGGPTSPTRTNIPRRSQENADFAVKKRAKIKSSSGTAMAKDNTTTATEPMQVPIGANNSTGFSRSKAAPKQGGPQNQTSREPPPSLFSAPSSTQFKPANHQIRKKGRGLSRKKPTNLPSSSPSTLANQQMRTKKIGLSRNNSPRNASSEGLPHSTQRQEAGADLLAREGALNPSEEEIIVEAQNNQGMSPLDNSSTSNSAVSVPSNGQHSEARQLVSAPAENKVVEAPLIEAVLVEDDSSTRTNGDRINSTHEGFQDDEHDLEQQAPLIVQAQKAGLGDHLQNRKLQCFIVGLVLFVVVAVVGSQLALSNLGGDKSSGALIPIATSVPTASPTAPKGSNIFASSSTPAPATILPRPQQPSTPQIINTTHVPINNGSYTNAEDYPTKFPNATIPSVVNEFQAATDDTFQVFDDVTRYEPSPGSVIDWTGADEYCTAQGQQLATLAQICPNGPGIDPVGGKDTTQENWVAIADLEGDTTLVGTFHIQAYYCASHVKVYHHGTVDTRWADGLGRPEENKYVFCVPQRSTTTAHPTPSDLVVATTSSNDPNLNSTGPWSIFPVNQLVNQGRQQTFNAIVIESDWHSKRPKDLSLNACDTSVCDWSHQLGMANSINCNTDVYEYLENGPNKMCDYVIGRASFSMCVLPIHYLVSDVGCFDLQVLSAGGNPPKVLRTGAWFVLTDRPPDAEDNPTKYPTTSPTEAPSKSPTKVLLFGRLYDKDSSNAISLTSNGLTGPIPTELGLMTALRFLDFSWNRLSGIIPTELGLLTSLTDLQLQKNSLAGPIHTELGLLTALRRLSLGGRRDGNQPLTGPIPTELGLMTYLTWLTLYDNQVTGPIPTELGMMTELEKLVLYQNQLTGPIPTELGLLTALYDLRLYNNQLTGTVPDSLCSLPGLEVELKCNENPTMAPVTTTPTQALAPTTSSCSLNPEDPEDCAAVKSGSDDSMDGTYLITNHANCIEYLIYCAGMDTNEPKEYISLTTPNQFETNDHFIKGQTTTTFTKVRFDPKALQLMTLDSDFAVAGASGKKHAFGDVGDCAGRGSSSGSGTIDLRDTPFAVSSGWLIEGYNPGEPVVNGSFNNQVIELKGGGFCGHICPSTNVTIVSAIHGDYSPQFQSHQVNCSYNPEKCCNGLIQLVFIEINPPTP